LANLFLNLILILLFFFSAHKDDLETVNELLSTLGALVVREEFCREVEECGGISIILDIMVTYPDDEVSLFSSNLV
jgi:hypothetical protein